MATDTCKHRRLHFGGGGFLIVCSECGHTWASSKDGGHTLDKDSPTDGLSSQDKRVEPCAEKPE